MSLREVFRNRCKLVVFQNNEVGSVLQWEQFEQAVADYEKSLLENIEKLEAFKTYVHQRLDEAEIEKEPNGEHSKHGCRIGDRLDIVLNKIWFDADKLLPDLHVKVITDSGNEHYNIASYHRMSSRWVNVSGHTLHHVIRWTEIPTKP